MKNKGIWKALLYFGVAVLAVVCLFLLRGTVLDTYSTAEYNSFKTKVSEKAIGLMFVVVISICVLFCKAIWAKVLGVGRALAAYAGIVISVISLFLPRTVLNLRWINVRTECPYHVYETLRSAVWATDIVCIFGIFVLVVMVLGSMNSDYGEAVKKAMVGMGLATLVPGVVSLGFKTLKFNSWLFAVPALSVMFGCVVLFLCWTKKMLKFSFIDGMVERLIADCVVDEDELDDEE